MVCPHFFLLTCHRFFASDYFASDWSYFIFVMFFVSREACDLLCANAHSVSAGVFISFCVFMWQSIT
uniref:Uncharacterized protein n=1 Tax=Anguilla anguilla TaxID=7936 RepID=A0A0E9WUZ3_ANGAN